MKRDDEALQRYLDGDLSPEELAEVEVWLDESAEARAALRELEAVGEAVRVVALDRSAGAIDLVDGIMARVGLENGAAKGVAPPPGRPEPGRSRWLRLAPPLALALAAAAAFAVYLRPGVKAPGGAAGGASAAVAVAVSVRLEAPAEAESVAVVEPSPQAEPDPGASIESVDFGAQNGSIFMVAVGSEATPVVWLVDEPEGNQDRMTPL